jgi:RNA polymerase sigma-70 factor, ECF subfamily
VGRLDEAAFAAFYARSVSGLRAYVHRVVGDRADADDIVQEAFLRMLRADLETDDEEQWRRYLYRIASNLIVDNWRRRKLEQQDRAATHAPASAPPRYDDDATVARIFAELKPRERALLWLAYVEGESHEEIAASLGVGRRGVRVMLFRAKRHLRDLLQARGVLAKS